MEKNGPGHNGTKTNARSTDYLEYCIKHYELQPRQENLLRWYMEEPEALHGLWAAMRQDNVTVRVYPADWDAHKKAAGPIRNKKC